MHCKNRCITYILCDHRINRQALQDGTDQFLRRLANRGLGLFEYLGIGMLDLLGRSLILGRLVLLGRTLRRLLSLESL